MSSVVKRNTSHTLRQAHLIVDKRDINNSATSQYSSQPNWANQSRAHSMQISSDITIILSLGSAMAQNPQLTHCGHGADARWQSKSPHNVRHPRDCGGPLLWNEAIAWCSLGSVSAKWVSQGGLTFYHIGSLITPDNQRSTRAECTQTYLADFQTIFTNKVNNLNSVLLKEKWPTYLNSHKAKLPLEPK